MAMRFKPFLLNGMPVQVISQVSVSIQDHTASWCGKPFRAHKVTLNAEGKMGFPAAGAGIPYVLRAEFEARNSSGKIEDGRYEDTWLADSQWRREAWYFGDSHYARSRSGEKAYQLAEGSQSMFLQFIFRVLEPIPAIDTLTESDWKIKRDQIDGVPAIRVLAGYESP